MWCLIRNIFPLKRHTALHPMSQAISWNADSCFECRLCILATIEMVVFASAADWRLLESRALINVQI
jgi:Fe-S-cluster-containing hydrogenase component 2